MKKKWMVTVNIALLCTPTLAFAEETFKNKVQQTPATVQTKLTKNGGRTEEPTNNHAIACDISGNTDLEKSWGYGYIPIEMNTKNQKIAREALKDEGEQSIVVGCANSDQQQSQITHLGVKNKSRQTGAWSLSARTDLDTQLAGKGIQVTWDKVHIRDRYKAPKGNSGVNIQDNELTAFDSKALTHTAKLSLNSDNKEIFQGKEGIVHNGFYNVQLEKAHIDIPNVRRIQNDDFKCNITWNLAKVPGAAGETA